MQPKQIPTGTQSAFYVLAVKKSDADKAQELLLQRMAVVIGASVAQPINQREAEELLGFSQKDKEGSAAVGVEFLFNLEDPELIEKIREDLEPINEEGLDQETIDSIQADRKETWRDSLADEILWSLERFFEDEDSLSIPILTGGANSAWGLS